MQEGNVRLQEKPEKNTLDQTLRSTVKNNILNLFPAYLLIVTLEILIDRLLNRHAKRSFFDNKTA